MSYFEKLRNVIGERKSVNFITQEFLLSGDIKKALQTQKEYDARVTAAAADFAHFSEMDVVQKIIKTDQDSNNPRKIKFYTGPKSPKLQ